MRREKPPRCCTSRTSAQPCRSPSASERRIWKTSGFSGKRPSISVRGFRAIANGPASAGRHTCVVSGFSRTPYVRSVRLQPDLRPHNRIRMILVSSLRSRLRLRRQTLAELKAREECFGILFFESESETVVEDAAAHVVQREDREADD